MSILEDNTDIEYLFRTHSDMVFRIALHYTANYAEAQDITMDVFVQLIKYINELSGGEHIKAWLIRTTINRCKNYFRLARVTRTSSISDELSSVLSAPLDDGESELLEEVFALPSKYKDVIYMYYYEGYKSEEIAKILKISTGTVRKRLQRGRALLKITLEGEAI